jgi:hypothetical protein
MDPVIRSRDGLKPRWVGILAPSEVTDDQIRKLPRALASSGHCS